MGHPDCQHLNIYTPPDTSPEDKLPVMVFFHGGAFQFGSATSLYGPVYLTSKGVILVSANYRLNAQGFLCLGIKEAPGNAGMKDQVAAMKWVQRNIRAFGGDPDNVTIFGESAGGASVSYHVISPMSKGLFHKAIIQSGSSLASWAFQFDPIFAASKKAKLLGLQSSDPHEIYNFMYSQTDESIVTKMVPREEGNMIMSTVLFVPCAEKHIEGVEPFLTKTPYEIYSSGNFNKVPMMMGFNSEEGLFFVNMEPDDVIPRIKFDVSLPKNLAFPTDRERRKVAGEFQKLFMAEKEINFQNLYNLSRFVGNAFIEFPVLNEMDLILQNTDKPVYNYLFSYDGRRNIAKLLRRRNEFVNITGATHADELAYLFSHPYIPLLYENDMIDKMTTMWTNFAKYGDPIPTTSDLLPVKWPPVAKEEENRKTLLIDRNLTVIPQPRNPALTLCKDVFQKYRRKHSSY